MGLPIWTEAVREEKKYPAGIRLSTSLLNIQKTFLTIFFYKVFIILPSVLLLLFSS